jgi:hypothetical protein
VFILPPADFLYILLFYPQKYILFVNKLLFYGKKHLSGGFLLVLVLITARIIYPMGIIGEEKIGNSLHIFPVFLPSYSAF